MKVNFNIKTVNISIKAFLHLNEAIKACGKYSCLNDKYNFNKTEYSESHIATDMRLTHETGWNPLLWFLGKVRPGIRPYSRKGGHPEQLGPDAAGSNGKFNWLICSFFSLSHHAFMTQWTDINADVSVWYRKCRYCVKRGDYQLDFLRRLLLRTRNSTRLKVNRTNGNNTFVLSKIN